MQKYNLPLGLFRDSDASDKHQEVEDQAQRLKERVNPVRKRKQKNAKHELDVLFAEREGFEPPVPLSTTVFKTVVIDHSTISPVPELLQSGCKGSTLN